MLTIQRKFTIKKKWNNIPATEVVISLDQKFHFTSTSCRVLLAVVMTSKVKIFTKESIYCTVKNKLQNLDSL